LIAWRGVGFPCSINSGVDFPVQNLDSAAVCRIADVVNDYTTFELLPSVDVPIQKALYDFLLDHPPLTSSIVRHYNFGNYRVAQISPTIFAGQDNEGGEATLTLLYGDDKRRVYHLKGSQRGYLYPLITGSGIVMLTYHSKLSRDGRESIDTQVVVFSRLDNRFLARLVKVLRPILQRIINNKLTKGVRTVHRVTEYLATDPEQVIKDIGMFTSDPAEAEAFRTLLLAGSKKRG
jgi:hypothetical protein